MLWPRPSMVFTKPRSFTGAGRGARSRPSSSLLWNGSIGSTTGGSWSQSEISPRPKPRNATTTCWSSQTWRRDSNKMASAKPGAVQSRHRNKPVPARPPVKTPIPSDTRNPCRSPPRRHSSSRFPFASSAPQRDPMRRVRRRSSTRQTGSTRRRWCVRCWRTTVATPPC